jgi:hypothetical protein
MRKLKIAVCEAALFLLCEIGEVDVNFIFFYEVELLKLRLFGRLFLELN